MNNDIIKLQLPAAMNIATISAGFEKGDFLVREEQGNRVYFDFFEEVGSQYVFWLCHVPLILSLMTYEFFILFSY